MKRIWRTTAPGIALLALAGMLTLQTGCRAEEQWPLWQHYRSRFLDASGRIIDHSAADRTTSEGQSYGMFFALVANDRKSFDLMLRWTEDNLASGDLTAHLPVWNWGNAGGGEWKPLDSNSAADSDVWIAYDCIEAGRLWHDDRLSKLGAVLAEHIAQSELAQVPGIGMVLLPGSQGFHPTPDKWVLNPSYMPPQVVARLQQELPESRWSGVQNALPTVLARSASAGFAMDWLVAGAASVRPAAKPEEVWKGNLYDGALGGYEAIRVYLWLGMADPGTPGVREGAAALLGMADYLRAASVPPEQVSSDGAILSPNSPVGFSAAVYPFLVATGHKDEAQQQMNRVAAGLDSGNGLYGRNAAYYDQNLVMFATGWKDGRFRFDRNGQVLVRWK